ncbi:MAG: acyl-ACP--UDP-N-acetylglucosamine O-acyltransferase [Rhodospirillales bacterium]|nr:acyl-ACP--UDP-N-acetylglucosamine O-acyltransferase [Rhodospirillales bacterium]MCB9995624.1 acyl-ACP--UDP-N-acetylglucosamine O-acyltransferase [Rhodospirillales bacterium]
MTQNIHPTAIIEDGAEIGANVQIGPYSVIGPQVKLADNVIIHAHVVLSGITSVGEGTEIFPFASIGSRCQDKKYDGEPAELVIGKHNVIREHVTMNPGTKGGGMKTVVGDHGLFMVACHVAHDCVIGDHVIMANNATLGGHVHVGNYAVIGGLAAVHQFVRIGAYAVIGGMSGVENDVIPFGRVKGERAFLAGLNLIGLERNGFSKDEIKTLQRAFNQLFGDDGTLEQRLDAVANNYEADQLVMNMVQFAKEKTRFPLCQPQRSKAA